MKTLLLIVSWLQSGPYVQVQTLDTPAMCRSAADTTARMIAAQATTNMTSPHNALSIEKNEKTGEWRLTTGAIGREVARISCVNQD